MSNDQYVITPNPEQPEKKKKRLGGILIIILSVLLIGGGITVGVMQFMRPASQAGALVDIDGNVVVPDDPSATSPAFMEQAQMVVDDGGNGFVVPSLNVDVPIGSINEVNGVMNPPNFTSVFWIRNRGVSIDNAAQGTVYMVAHAVYGGKAPGNLLQQNQQVSLNPGDIIKVNDKVYKYVETQIIPKTEIGDHDDLWTDDPGRLILVTCQVRAEGGIAVNNMVIIAQLQS